MRAGAETNKLVQAKGAGAIRKVGVGLALRFGGGQVTLGGGRPVLIEHLGKGESKRRVTQKLQPKWVATM